MNPKALMAAAAGCLVLVTTGCSKSSAGPSVAKLAAPTSSAAASSAPGSSAPGSSAPDSSAPDSSSPASSAPPKGEAGLLAYSECMRSHGVPDFPDPVGNSLQLRAGPGSDLDPTSPKFVAAQNACKALQPGGAPGAKVSAAQQAEALKYSACMRENGVPNFPDPVFSNGGAQLKITNIDPNSPQFVAAQKACQSLQPIGGQTSNSGP
jgi:hypothetical protein